MEHGEESLWNFDHTINNFLCPSGMYSLIFMRDTSTYTKWMYDGNGMDGMDGTH
jgi:hypothetical protein